jgi:hypothetical protein
VAVTREHSTAVLAAAAASAAAGLVHAAAAGTHSGAGELVALFSVAAAVQDLVAGAALVTPSRTSLVAVAGVNVVAVGAWAFSRTTGLPWPELLKEAEDVGAQDLAAATLGAAAAVFAGLAVVEPAWARAKAAPTAMAGAVCTALLAIAVPGMAAQHDHGGAPDETHVHDDGHSHGHDEATADGEASGPIISLDDPRLTDEQREAAQELIDETAEAMKKFPDQAAVEAAGYISIGDSVTGFEHFINVGYIANDNILDPNEIESIVLTVDEDGNKEVASAMYILPFGKTMDDVPDIAGELTTWHDHQNLCWEGARVVGVLDANGNCPRGTFRPTPPMLHVWVPDKTPKCGPFAGIEGGGHGESCEHHSH